VEQSLIELCVSLIVVKAPLDDVEAMVNGNVTNSNGVCGAASSQRILLTKMLSESNNPDEKRKIIRDIFVKVANEAVTEMYLKPR